MKKILNSLFLTAVFISISAFTMAQFNISGTLTFNGSTNGAICKPGTILNCVIYMGYGCIHAQAVQLEYRLNSGAQWSVVKTYPNTNFQTQLGQGSGSFSDDISALSLSSGDFRFKFFRIFEYDCIHSYGNGLGNVDYTNTITITFLFNDAGSNKVYTAGVCNPVRVQIGLPSNIGPGNTCSPTYNWTPTTGLFTTQTGNTPCNPCTAAQVWAVPSIPLGSTWSRQMTCGSNICTDQVTVTVIYGTCGGGSGRISTSSGLTGDEVIKISPNPSLGHFSFSSGELPIGEIFIYNSIGQLIQHVNTAETTKEILSMKKESIKRG